jgi:hypothetical protein
MELHCILFVAPITQLYRVNQYVLQSVPREFSLTTMWVQAPPVIHPTMIAAAGSPRSRTRWRLRSGLQRVSPRVSNCGLRGYDAGTEHPVPHLVA